MRRSIRFSMLVAATLALSACGNDGGEVNADDREAIEEEPAGDEELAEEEAEPEETEPDEAAAQPCPPADDAPEVDSQVYEEPPLADLEDDATYTATVETTCGSFTMELDTTGAPTASANLVGLAEEGYYDGVLFHRIIEGFVIQVGDPAGTGCGQEDCAAFDPDEPTYPGYRFEDELGTAEDLFAEVGGGYPRGTVAMANAGPDTNGSQFFVAQGDPTGLPGPAYTVLGTVVDGMDVVDRIAAQPTAPDGRPDEDIRIVTIDVTQQ